MVGLVGSLSTQAAWSLDAEKQTSRGKDRTAAELAAGVAPVNFDYPELDPRRYGIDTSGATDSQAGIAALLSVAEKYDSAFIRFPQNSALRCDSGLTIDTNKVGIDWQGDSQGPSCCKPGACRYGKRHFSVGDVRRL